jgi:hypothetical protein
VQDVRYAPSGDHFASVGADAKVFLYDGKTGDVLGELAGDAHTGTVVRVRAVDLPFQVVIQYTGRWHARGVRTTRVLRRRRWTAPSSFVRLAAAVRAAVC